MDSGPPTYDEYAQPLGDGLLEVEDGLTANQRGGGRSRSSLLGGATCFAANMSHHMMVLYVLWFVSFVIACSAMAKANRLGGANGGGGGFRPEDGAGTDGGAVNHWLSRCEYMEYALYGDDVFEYGGHHYQIVGGNWAKMTWRSSESDAWGRCYDKAPGYLASIGSSEENDFLTAKMVSHHGFASGDEAWIGATDMSSEGTFAWLDGYLRANVFWTNSGPVAGTYSNFGPGEPNENGEEDCVSSGADGKWNDQSCYKQMQYFFVEFDA